MPSNLIFAYLYQSTATAIRIKRAHAHMSLLNMYIQIKVRGAYMKHGPTLGKIPHTSSPVSFPPSAPSSIPRCFSFHTLLTLLYTQLRPPSPFHISSKHSSPPSSSLSSPAMVVVVMVQIVAIVTMAVMLVVVIYLIIMVYLTHIRWYYLYNKYVFIKWLNTPKVIFIRIML